MKAQLEAWVTCGKPPSFKSEHLGAAAAALGYGITTGSKYFGTTTLVSGDAAFTSAINVCSR